MVDVATDSTDQTVGESQSSTLANLSENIAKVVTGDEAKTSETEGATATTPAEGTQAAAPETKAAEAPAEDAGTITRLQQESAKQKSALRAMGIDPESEIIDHLDKGIIDAEYIRKQYLGAPKIEPVSQEVPLNQKIANLQDALKKQGQNTEGVSNAEYLATQNTILEVVNGLVGEIGQYKDRERDNSVTQHMNQCIDATKEVYSHSDVYNSLPEETRDIAGAMILGATDLGVAGLAAKVGQERAFTTRGYAAVSKDVTGQFEALYKSAYSAGHKDALAGLKDKGTVNPIQSSTGGAPVAKSSEPMTLDNLKKNTDAYLGNTQLQV